MSRRTMPYHRRYHQDALQGYRVLTLEQRGAYTTILDLIYDHGGPIDNNERWLAGELNCSLRKARALIAELVEARKLYITGRGQISNHRAEAELENALKISRTRAENASKREGKISENPKFQNKNNARNQQMQSRSAVIPYTRTRYIKDNSQYDAARPSLDERIAGSVPPAEQDEEQQEATSRVQRADTAGATRTPAACRLFNGTLVPKALADRSADAESEHVTAPPDHGDRLVAALDGRGKAAMHAMLAQVRSRGRTH